MHIRFRPVVDTSAIAVWVCRSALNAIILSPFSDFGNSINCCIRVIFCSVGLGFGVFLPLYLYSMFFSQLCEFIKWYLYAYIFLFILVIWRPCCPGGPFLSGRYSISCNLHISPSFCLRLVTGWVGPVGGYRIIAVKADLRNANSYGGSIHDWTKTNMQRTILNIKVKIRKAVIIAYCFSYFFFYV